MGNRDDALSWLPPIMRGDPSPSNGDGPRSLKRLHLSRDALQKATGTPWRASARVVVPDLDGDFLAATNALATATGASLTEGSAVTNAPVVTFDVPDGYVGVVDEVVLWPGDDLAWDVLEFALVDGRTSGLASVSGRIEQAMNRQVLVYPARADVVPVTFVVAGDARICLQVTTTDPEAPHYLEAEMRGWTFESSQFRIRPC